MCMSGRRDIIRHGKNWKLWVLCDRDPVEKWIDGRVVLLGDAAHPMLQYFAQGACMALEDAVCLSHMLATPIRTITPPRSNAIVAQRFARTARDSAAIPRHRRAHLSSRRRTRPPPQRHHGREDVGGLLRAISSGCMAGRGWGSRYSPATTAVHDPLRMAERVGVRGIRSIAESMTPHPALRSDLSPMGEVAPSRPRKIATSSTTPAGRSCPCRSSAILR